MEWASSVSKHLTRSTPLNCVRRALRTSIMSRDPYVTPDTGNTTFTPGEHVYALVYIQDRQVSGWVEAVVVEEEAMPGTIASDGTPQAVTFYKVSFGSNGLTDTVSPKHGAVFHKTDDVKTAINTGKGVWIKGI